MPFGWFFEIRPNSEVGYDMVKITVCCVGCGMDFTFDTEDPSVLIDIYKSANMPRISIKPCPHCGKQNKVKIPI
jgi:transcription elongation factor Elf1